MVAKISLGDSVYGALRYNGEKINKEQGRVLDTNKIYNDGSGNIDIHRAYEDFKRWMPQATKTERTMMHISLNPHPDDLLTEMDYVKIANEYMEKMGFAEMPYIIVKHEDIDRHHIHIVALRVRPDGTCISDKNNFYKSKNICRELEQKYGLHTAERQRVDPNEPIKKIAPAGNIKRQVANTVKVVGMRYKFQTMGEYNAILRLYNVKCEQTDGRVNGREYHGLVYYATNDNGEVIATPFKASRLGKFASRTAIDGRFERAAEKIDVSPTKRTVTNAMASATGKDDFIAKLKVANIDLVLRYTDEGRIYGATYIDHNTQTVLNGSRLGREFSANALEQWFNDPAQKPAITPIPELSQSQSQQYTPGGNATSQSQGQNRGQNQANSQQPSHFSVNNYQDNNYDDAHSLPGLDLFQVGPGFDAQEEAFYREMQRRKKKKRRGPRL